MSENAHDNWNGQGEVGPSPSADDIPAGDPVRTGGGLSEGETDEEEDPGDAQAGGVNARNAGA